MFKKLRWQIILIELGAFLFITILICGTINLIYSSQIKQNAHQVLTIIAKNRGDFQSFLDRYDEIVDKAQYNRASGDQANDTIEKIYNYFKIKSGFDIKINEETPYTTRYFWATVDEKDEIIDWDVSHISYESVDDIDEYVNIAQKSKKTEGSADKFRYLKEENGKNTTIYFVDCYSQISYKDYLLMTSLYVALISMLLATIFVWFFSKKAISPLQKNIETQKRFITDASHELKTPLAAISANIDVLELTEGENQTTNKIKHQISQMSGLIEEMLTLSRMDNAQIKAEDFEDINFSELVEQKTSEFFAIAQSKGKSIKTDISSDINIKGIRSGLERLVSVLCDNAVKYCTDGGEIIVSVGASSSVVKLEVSNTSENLNDEDLKHLFDRFYRTDSSRSKETGGYGIGLSIAKAVVDQHKGKISASSKHNIVKFTVELPIK